MDPQGRHQLHQFLLDYEFLLHRRQQTTLFQMVPVLLLVEELLVVLQ